MNFHGSLKVRLWNSRNFGFFSIRRNLDAGLKITWVSSSSSCNLLGFTQVVIVMTPVSYKPFLWSVKIPVQPAVQACKHKTLKIPKKTKFLPKNHQIVTFPVHNLKILVLFSRKLRIITWTVNFPGLQVHKVPRIAKKSPFSAKKASNCETFSS